KEVTAALDEAEQTLQELHQKLADPREVARFLSNLEPWEKALHRSQAAWQRAVALAGSSQEPLGEGLSARQASLQQQLEVDQQVSLVARRLDDIRLAASTLTEGKFDLAAAGPKYQAALARLQLDVEKAEPAQLAARIKELPLRYVLVAALDDWALFIS